MNSFIVIVTCLAHLKACPIPNGYHGDYKAANKESCEHKAKMVIAGFGYPERDFRVRCEEK